MSDESERQKLLKKIYEISPNSNLLPNPSTAQLRSILKMKQDYALAKERSASFWKTLYPEKTFQEKVDWWAGKMNKTMRSYSEYCPLDASMSTAFTPRWYRSAKEKEPKIDSILVEVIVNTPVAINPDVFYQSIEQPLPQQFVD